MFGRSSRCLAGLILLADLGIFVVREVFGGSSYAVTAKIDEISRLDGDRTVVSAEPPRLTIGQGRRAGVSEAKFLASHRAARIAGAFA